MVTRGNYVLILLDNYVLILLKMCQRTFSNSSGNVLKIVTNKNGRKCP